MITGPNIVRGDDLGVAIDASSERGLSAATETNILDYSTWIAGNSSATGFSRNGSAAENVLLSGTGPFGESTVIWEARPEGNNSSDGGWNSSQFSIDNNKLYRFSVWVKRSVYVDGRFYFGTRGYGSTNGVFHRHASTSSTTNPYAYVSSDPPTTGQMPSNTWMLVVFHVWPQNSGTGDQHPDSGRYTIANGKIGNISHDWIWRPQTTTATHRTYLYYSAATTPRQQWVYPRVDIIDGNEPTIDELLGGNTRQYTNLVNPGKKFNIRNNLRARAASNIGRNKVKKFEFDGTDDAIKVDGGTTTSIKRTIELVFRVNSTPNTYNPIAVFTRESGGTESNKRVWLGIQGNKFQMHGWGTTDPASTTSVTGGSYYHCVYAYDQSTKKHYIWVNGTLENNSTNSQAGFTGWTNTSGLYWWLGHDPQAASWTTGAGTHFDGDISIFKTYSKVLTNGQVRRNYRAYKKRFEL